MKTSLQSLNNPHYNDVLIAGRRAVDVYRDMWFTAVNGKPYRVWNVYVVSHSQCPRIAVSAAEWWTSYEVVNWIMSLGEGKEIQVPEYGRGVVDCILPNRTCFVKFENGSIKSFRESDLLALPNGLMNAIACVTQ